MSILRSRPHPPLNQHVEMFWHRNAKPGSTQWNAKEVILPDGCAHLIINLSQDSIRFAGHIGCEAVTTCDSSIFCGPSSSPYAVLPSGSAVMGVVFRPGGAFPFLPVPPEELRDFRIPAQAIFGPRITYLRDQLLVASDVPQKFARLEQSLLRSLRPPLAVHRAVIYAVRAFEEAFPPTVSQILKTTGLSERQFSRVFSQQIGLTPKLFQRVRRFQRTIASFESGTHVGWAEQALASGYYDQAHLIHEFRTFSSVTPSVFLASGIVLRNHLPLPA